MSQRPAWLAPRMETRVEMSSCSLTRTADNPNSDGKSFACHQSPAVRDEPDCQRITRGIQAGNADCFAEFYDRFFATMLSEARRLLGSDEHTCLDLVHDAMLKSMRSMRQFESESKLDRWCQLVVRTTALDWLRKKSRRRESPTDPPPGSDAATIDTPAAERSDQSLLDQARRVWIEEQLDRSDAQVRQLLSLRYRFGWTLQQIGSHLGIQPGAVDGRIRRAVNALKKKSRTRSPC